MERSFTLLFLPLFVLMACKGPKPEPVPAAPPVNNPAAFDDNKSEYALMSKSRYRDDMVDALYKELLKENEVLTKLEKAIEGLDEQRSDSLELFKNFDTKNKDYYASAESHAGTITDSVLKKKMITLIANSREQYNRSTLKHNNLVALLNTKDTDIRNLHTVLKIVKTLPLTEKFQAENMPSATPMEKMLATYIRLIQQADNLSNTK